MRAICLGVRYLPKVSGERRASREQAGSGERWTACWKRELGVVGRQGAGERSARRERPCDDRVCEHDAAWSRAGVDRKLEPENACREDWVRADKLGVGQQRAMQVEWGDVGQSAEHGDGWGPSRQRKPRPVGVCRQCQHGAHVKHGCERIDERHASGGWCWEQGRVRIDTARTHRV